MSDEQQEFDFTALLRERFADLPGDATYMEAASYLDHTSTSRVRQLVKDGRLVPGSKKGTVQRPSVIKYDRARKVQGLTHWYKVELGPEDVEHLSALGYRVERLYTYNADKRKSHVLHTAVQQFEEEHNPSLHKQEQMLNKADEREADEVADDHAAQF